MGQAHQFNLEDRLDLSRLGDQLGQSYPWGQQGLSCLLGLVGPSFLGDLLALHLLLGQLGLNNLVGPSDPVRPEGHSHLSFLFLPVDLDFLEGLEDLEGL